MGCGGGLGAARFQALQPTGAQQFPPIGRFAGKVFSHLPLICLLYSIQQPCLHRSTSAVLVYVPALGGGTLTSNTYISPLAGGFGETRPLSGVWDFSCCISESLDVLMSTNKESREAGKSVASREHANRKLFDYVHGCKIRKRI